MVISYQVNTINTVNTVRNNDYRQFESSDYMLPPSGRLANSSQLDNQLRGMRPRGFLGSNLNVQSGPLGHMSESAETGFGGQLTAVNSYGGLG